MKSFNFFLLLALFSLSTSALNAGYNPLVMKVTVDETAVGYEEDSTEGSSESEGSGNKIVVSAEFIDGNKLLSEIDWDCEIRDLQGSVVDGGSQKGNESFTWLTAGHDPEYYQAFGKAEKNDDFVKHEGDEDLAIVRVTISSHKDKNIIIGQQDGEDEELVIVTIEPSDRVNNITWKLNEPEDANNQHNGLVEHAGEIGDANAGKDARTYSLVPTLPSKWLDDATPGIVSIIAYDSELGITDDEATDESDMELLKFKRDGETAEGNDPIEMDMVFDADPESDTAARYYDEGDSEGWQAADGMIALGIYTSPNEGTYDIEDALSGEIVYEYESEEDRYTAKHYRVTTEGTGEAGGDLSATAKNNEERDGITDLLNNISLSCGGSVGYKWTDDTSFLNLDVPSGAGTLTSDASDGDWASEANRILKLVTKGVAIVNDSVSSTIEGSSETISQIFTQLEFFEKGENADITKTSSPYSGEVDTGELSYGGTDDFSHAANAPINTIKLEVNVSVATAAVDQDSSSPDWNTSTGASAGMWVKTATIVFTPKYGE